MRMMIRCEKWSCGGFGYVFPALLELSCTDSDSLLSGSVGGSSAHMQSRCPSTAGFLNVGCAAARVIHEVLYQRWQLMVGKLG